MLYWTRADDAYRRIAGAPHPTILMYHSVCAEEDAPWVAPRNRMNPRLFESQLRFLARKRNVIALGEFLRKCARGEPIPPKTVIITFDDGYRDNLTVAAPLLAKYGLPAVLYLATGYVGRAENQWADVIHATFMRAEGRLLQLEGIGSYDLRTDAGRRSAQHEIVARLRASSYSRRKALLDQVATQLAPRAGAPRLTLTWDEVRVFAREHPQIELGVHTADHVDLSTMTAEEGLSEVARSVSDLERETGRRAQHFSFPYSRANEGVRRALSGLGLASAVTGSEGIRQPESIDPFDLGRLESPLSMALLGHWTSGAHPAMSRRLFGRA